MPPFGRTWKSSAMASNSETNSIAESGWLYRPAFPESWEHHALYSLATWINGMAFKNINFSPNGRPVIKIAEIKNGITDQTKFTECDYDPRYFVKRGELLFSWSGQPETSIDAFYWDGPDGWLNQHVFKVVSNSPACTPRFLYYILKYLKPNFIGIARNKQTTGLGHVTKADLEAIHVGIPDRPTQDRITHVLGKLDARLTANRRINRTLEKMAAAIFKSWFIDFDPVHAKTDGRNPSHPAEIADLFPDFFEDSDLGEIPEGWDIGRLDDLLVLQRGFDLPVKKRQPGSVPVIMSSGPGDHHAEYKVIGPGVVTGRSGKLGKVFLIPNNFWPLNTTLWVKEFRRSRPCHAFMLLKELALETYNAGSAVPTLNRNHVHNLPVLLPPANLIDAYENIALSLYRKCWANEDQDRRLASLRDALLTKLLSGEIELPEAEAVAEEVSS